MHEWNSCSRKIYRERKFHLNQAKAEMLQFCLSPPRQSNPSILTAAAFCPIFICVPLDLQDDGEDKGDDNFNEDNKGGVLAFSLPNVTSRTIGFDDLVGGEPLKNGGEDDT